LDGALAEFERCVKEHHCTPWKQELFCRFIKVEDTERLQKIMDLSTNLHGEVNSMYDLVFAFIQCGKVRQAKKILEVSLEAICSNLLISESRHSKVL
jgi:leucine-rich PPR motif-containing protein